MILSDLFIVNNGQFDLPSIRDIRGDSNGMKPIFIYEKVSNTR